MMLSHDEIMRELFAARPRLGAAAFVIARDAQAAEDLFQNVALKALTQGATFEHEGALLSWATVSARREALDWLRRRKSEVPVLDNDVLDLLDAEHACAAPADTGRVSALRDCLEQMPAASRRLLELRYFEGRSCNEVAAEVGAGLDAVYQRLSRLHRQLRACVEQRLGGAQTEAT